VSKNLKMILQGLKKQNSQIIFGRMCNTCGHFNKKCEENLNNTIDLEFWYPDEIEKLNPVDGRNTCDLLKFKKNDFILFAEIRAKHGVGEKVEGTIELLKSLDKNFSLNRYSKIGIRQIFPKCTSNPNNYFRLAMYAASNPYEIDGVKIPRKKPIKCQNIEELQKYFAQFA